MYNFRIGNTSVIFNKSNGEINSIVINGKSLLKNNSDSTWPRVWPMMFPFNGRLYNNEYKHDEKIYKINDLNGVHFENKLHGFYDQLSWTIASKDNELICTSINTISKDIWPWDFQIKHIFTLFEDSIKIKTEILNKSKDVMYFNFGHHGAFQLDKNNPVVETELDEKYKICTSRYSTDDIGTSIKGRKIDVSKLDFEKYFFFQQINVKSKWVRIPKKNYSVLIDISDFDTLTFSRTDNNREWVYVEPWNGYQDYESDKNTKLRDKPRVISLQPKGIKVFNLNIKVVE